MAFKKLKIKKRALRGPVTVIVTDGGGFKWRDYRELPQGKQVEQQVFEQGGREYRWPLNVWGTQGVEVHLQTNGAAWFTWEEWLEFVAVVADGHNEINGQEKLF